MGNRKAEPNFHRGHLPLKISDVLDLKPRTSIDLFRVIDGSMIYVFFISFISFSLSLSVQQHKFNQ
jgi:hypothetical protein